MFRSRLSSDELELLFINCLDGVCDDGKFKELLIKYRMLEHLPVSKNNPQSGVFPDIDFFVGLDMPASKDMLRQYIPDGALDEDGCAGAFGKNPIVLKIVQEGLLSLTE